MKGVDQSSSYWVAELRSSSAEMSVDLPVKIPHAISKPIEHSEITMLAKTFEFTILAFWSLLSSVSWLVGNLKCIDC